MPHSQPTLGFILHDVARFLRKRFEQRAKCLALTRSQWQVLAFLGANEGIHQSGLAEILDIEGITLTRIIDKLEAKGLVKRSKHPSDRRVWLLHLTEAAHPLIAQMRELGDATRAEALEGLSEPDREHLTQMLTIMRKNLLIACEQPVEALEIDHV